ncbi:hypothetical protein HMI54_009274 [Coelomomyces lativittatus]|nr:hypothetical protein HMI54_009274 [Coelomomyces lativittatus]
MVKLVRALFDYKAQDAGNLSFSAGDIIQVFTVLESGWWDGISNDKRGWFPSNYVTPISIRSHNDEESWVQKYTADNKHYWYNKITEESSWNKPTENFIILPSHWIIQETPDGQNSYFYNQDTSEVHWTFPKELSHLIQQFASHPSKGNKSSTSPTSPTSSFTEDHLPKTDSISLSLSSSPSKPLSIFAASMPHGEPSCDQSSLNSVHLSSPIPSHGDTCSSTSSTPMINASNLSLHHEQAPSDTGSCTFLASEDSTPTQQAFSLNPCRISALYSKSISETSLDDDANLPLSTTIPNPLLPLPPLPPLPPPPLNYSNTMEGLNTSSSSTLTESNSSYAQNNKESSASSNEVRSNLISDLPQNEFSTIPVSATIHQPSIELISAKQGFISLSETSYLTSTEPANHASFFLKKEKQDSAIVTLPFPPLPPSPSHQQTPLALPSSPTPTSSSFSNLQENGTHTELPGSKEVTSYPFPSLPLLLPPSTTLLSHDEEQMQAWALLTQQIFSSIHKLHKCAKSNLKNQYIMTSSKIVDAIRSTLVASKTADKESPVIKENPILKAHHRALLGALSKLVLSAKLASGVWPPPDAVQKMIMDASELLSCVKSFVEVARESGIEISTDIVEQRRRAFSTLEATSPSILSDSSVQLSPQLSDRRSSSPMILHSNISTVSSTSSSNFSSTSISASTTTTHKSFPLSESFLQQLDGITQNVIETLKKLEEQAHQSISVATLIFLTRIAVTQVGQFLTLIEDIHLEKGPECPLLHEFKVSKQSLYNNIAGLVMATQAVTSASPPTNAMDQVLLSINIVESSVKEVLLSTRQLWNANSYQSVAESNRDLPESPSPLEGSKMQKDEDSQNGKCISKDDVNKMEQENDKISISGQNDSHFFSPSHSLKSLDQESTPNTPKSHLFLNTQLANSFSPTSKASDAAIKTSSAHVSETSINSRFPSAAPAFPNLNASPSSCSSISPCTSANSNCNLALMPNTSSNFLTLPSSGSYSNSASPPNTPSSAKLRKFFGDDADTASKEALSLSQQRSKEETPWFLQTDYNPSEIVFNLEGQVKGGTINALVERLTMHSKYDPSFTSAFLLTYRTFMTTKDLFDALVQRFGITAPEGLTNAELETWIEKKMTPIRLRVFNVMKSWLENYCLPYIPDDHQILESMSLFARIVVRPVMSLLSISMTKLIDKRIASSTPHLPLRGPQPTTPITHVTAHIPFPPSILPRNLNKFKFMDVDPLEIARQLTLIEFSLFSRIIYTEFLNKAWSSDRGVSETEARARAPNLRRMIEMSNRVTSWVADTILAEEDPRRRCLLVKQFIAIANQCKQLHNFNTLFSILSALHSAPIHRLSRTWDMVSPKSLCVMNELTSIIDPHKNFNIYRDLLHALTPPCIPFLGRYLSDLTFLEDGQPNVLKPMAKEQHLLLINFGKRFKIAEIIREVQQFQIVPFHLKPVPEIQSFLMEMIDRTSGETSQLYEVSLHLEPRERDDEKLVRLLEESGLL